MDAARYVGDLEAMLGQKSRHLHAAAAVVAQAGDGTGFVQLIQSGGDGLHGHVHQVQAFGLGAGGLHFPAFTHIQEDGALCLAFGPIGDLCRGNLFHDLLLGRP